jgi:hypothetical protein
VLVEARPACRPTQLLVAIPLPETEAVAEIRLKLNKPLAGKPEPLAELHWEGVPSEFTASPFLLTMDTDISKIEGLRGAPCTSPAAKKR